MTAEAENQNGAKMPPIEVRDALAAAVGVGTAAIAGGLPILFVALASALTGLGYGALSARRHSH